MNNRTGKQTIGVALVVVLMTMGFAPQAQALEPPKITVEAELIGGGELRDDDGDDDGGDSEDPCDFRYDEGPSAPGPVGLDGTSEWSIGALMEKCTTIATPMVPAYADIGSVGPPFKVTPEGDKTSCMYNSYGNNGWEFTVWATASIQDGSYVGNLPFKYSESQVDFDLEDDYYETAHHHQTFDDLPGDEAERAACEATRAAMLGNALAEAYAWVQTQLDQQAAVDCTGSLSLIPDASGDYIVATGNMDGLCELSYHVLTRAWEFSGTFLLPQTDGVTIVVKVNGSSFFLSPDEEYATSVVGDLT